MKSTLRAEIEELKPKCTNPTSPGHIKAKKELTAEPVRAVGLAREPKPFVADAAHFAGRRHVHGFPRGPSLPGSIPQLQAQQLERRGSPEVPPLDRSAHRQQINDCSRLLCEDFALSLAIIRRLEKTKWNL